MAKTFVRISLATKFRVLFAGAVLAIIAAALGVPWYFTERLWDEAVEQTAGEVATMSMQEWMRHHHEKPRPVSELAAAFSAMGSGRRGPNFVVLAKEREEKAQDPSARRALRAFRDDHKRKLVVIPEQDEQGERVYRSLYAVRARNSCRGCHDGVAAAAFQPGQLVGLIDLTIPSPPSSMIWWTRGIFLLGGLLAAILAFIVFYLITKQIILSPVRKLRALADKVAEGDLSQRSTLATGDEFERLGKRFNEMLDAIQSQQDQLRQANRALDLRLNELAEANVSLWDANRIKNEFLANVSHELRTPLNSIIGFADLLSDNPDEKQKRYAQNILTSARMLLAIINDLLDLAKIEAGKMEVRNEKVSLRDLCETLAQLVRPLADQKKLVFDVQLDPELPVISTDPRRIQQVLYNLLSNAIKFTPAEGKFSLSARAVGEESPFQKPAVAIAVADTGPGISAADQQSIYEKFHRLDNPLTREHGGAGLGLAISKELTDLVGGRIVLESEPGHGATFTLYVPLLPPERAEPTKVTVRAAVAT